MPDSNYKPVVIADAELALGYDALAIDSEQFESPRSTALDGRRVS